MEKGKISLGAIGLDIKITPAKFVAQN